MHKLSQELKTKLFEKIIDELGKAKAVLLTENYEYKFVEPKDKKFTLKELQDLVGGYLEIYPTPMFSPKAVILCDEDGLLKNREFNMLFFDVVGLKAVGNVLIVPKKAVNEE